MRENARVPASMIISGPALPIFTCGGSLTVSPAEVADLPASRRPGRVPPTTPVPVTSPVTRPGALVTTSMLHRCRDSGINAPPMSFTGPPGTRPGGTRDTSGHHPPREAPAHRERATPLLRRCRDGSRDGGIDVLSTDAARSGTRAGPRHGGPGAPEVTARPAGR